MSEEEETHILLATLATKLEGVSENVTKIDRKLDTITSKADTRSTVIHDKMDEIKHDAHLASLFTQRTDDRLASHEESDVSRFGRLYWIVGIGMGLWGGVLARLLFR